MHTAVRPFASIGVSLVGATAIAITPVIAPTLPAQIHHIEAQVQQVAVDLAAASNPFAAYGELYNDTVASLQTIISTFKTNGLTPILTTALGNARTSIQDIMTLLSSPGSLSVSTAGQPGVPFAAAPSLISALGSTVGQIGSNLTTVVPGLLKSALTDLLSANVEDATNQLLLVGLNALIPLTNLLAPAINAIAYPLQAVVSAIDHLGPLATILANPLQNVVNVLNTLNQGFLGLTPTNAMTVIGGLLGPVIEAPAALGAAVQNVINAARSGNLGNVVTSILSIPATVINGVLNGGFGPDLSSVINTGLAGVPLLAGGLLTSFGITLVNTGLGFIANLPGPVAALQTLVKLIAGALKAPSVVKTTKTATSATTSTAALPAASSIPAVTAATIALPAAAAKPAAKTSTTGASDTKPAGAKPADTGSADTKSSSTGSGDADSSTAGQTGGKGHGKGSGKGQGTGASDQSGTTPTKGHDGGKSGHHAGSGHGK